MKDKNRRRRVSADTVRRNAKEGGGGRKWFNLPKGMKEWSPDKAGTYDIDVLPYEVQSASHPDKVEKGVLWYKYEFKVHRNIGPNNEQVICPTSVGKKCPICEERAKLAKNWDENEDAIKTMNFQKFVAFNIKNPDDTDEAALFAMSRGKFAEPLEKELADGDDDIQGFFDVTDKGRTLKVRFSDATFEGRKYLEATRFDFKEREEMDEDEILGKVACLDNIFNVMPYDKLKALFLQLDEEEGDNDAGEKESDADKPEPEPEPDEPKWKKGDLVQWKAGKKVLSGKIVSINADDAEATVKDDDGDKHTVDLDDLQTAEDAKEPEPDEPKWKKGDKVQFKDGKKTLVGTVKKVSADEIIVATEDDEFELEPSDLSPASEDKEPEPEPEKPPFEPGDKVTWDDGDAKGVVVKVHSSGEKVKVKDKDDEESWQPIDEVKLQKGKAAKADKEDEETPKGKCPKGHKFAEDCEKYAKDCEKCPEDTWEACDAAHGKLVKKGKAGKGKDED